MKNYIFIIAESNQNFIMSAADMCDKGRKVFVKEPAVCLFKPNEKITEEIFKKILDSFSKKYKVVFLAIETETEILYTLRKGINQLSNGREFCLFKDCILNFGFSAQTDKFNCVISISKSNKNSIEL